MAPLPTRILRAGVIARPGECVRLCGRRGGWSLQVQHRAAADRNIERASNCVCVYEITPYTRINIIRKLEVAPRLHPHSWGRRTARPTPYSLAIRQRLPPQGTTRHRASGRSLESRMAIVQAVRLLC